MKTLSIFFFFNIVLLAQATKAATVEETQNYYREVLKTQHLYIDPKIGSANLICAIQQLEAIGLADAKTRASLPSVMRIEAGEGASVDQTYFVSFSRGMYPQSESEISNGIRLGQYFQNSTENGSHRTYEAIRHHVYHGKVFHNVNANTSPYPRANWQFKGFRFTAHQIAEAYKEITRVEREYVEKRSNGAATVTNDGYALYEHSTSVPSDRSSTALLLNVSATSSGCQINDLGKLQELAKQTDAVRRVEAAAGAESF